MQKEELRARFPGAPADVVNFFHYVAEEVRSELARLGAKSLDEVVGRPDLLRQRDVPLEKTANLDLSFLTQAVAKTESSSSQRCAWHGCMVAWVPCLAGCDHCKPTC